MSAASNPADPSAPRRGAGTTSQSRRTWAAWHNLALSRGRRPIRVALHLIRILAGRVPVPMRIAALVAAGCVASILITGLVAVRLGRDSLQRDWGAQTEQVSVQVARTLEAGLDTARTELARLSDHSGLRNAAGIDGLVVRATLAQFQSEHPAFAWLAFVQLDGTVLAATAGPAEGAAAVGQRWFPPSSARTWLPAGQRPVPTRPVPTRPVPAGPDPIEAPGWNAAGPSLPMLTRPVLDTADQVAGFVVGQIGEAWIDQVGNQYRPLLTPQSAGQAARTAQITVADRTGIVLSGPSRGRTVLDAARRDATLRSGQGWFVAETGANAGADILGYATAQLGGPDETWIVLARRTDPVGGMLDAAALVAMLLAAIAALALGVILSVELGNRITAPVARLAEDAMRIGRGIRASDIKAAPGGRAVELLSHALRSVARRVDALQRELDDSRAMVGAMSAHKAREIEALQRLTATDPMTGLLNRRGLAQAVETLLGSGREADGIGVLLIDIDHFKQVNDLHGHAAGDAVIRAVAATILNTVRQTDVVARLGGEEFVVVLPDTAPEALFALGDRIRLAVSDLAFAMSGSQVHVTLCAGAATMNPGDTDIQDTIDRADAALYRAKAAGRNRVLNAVGSKQAG